ncbi:MAG: site-specific DNA-methyltransferase [Bacteroidales bacterium]|nr:site-specific DNA-methyltransferase [Bacteroidales bacterium]
MEGYSQTPKEERVKILQSHLPEVFDEGKIDWEKLKATLGEEVSFANERYVLNWAGKSDAFRVMQQPSSATLIPCREESVDFDNTENIFIEGENMEVLKVLQKSYFGKVKMIYIDPPYNTGNDSFIYPDKFSESKEEYLRRVGDKDEEGYMTREGMFRKNSKENGQYHSNWLNMMMPRLYLAKSLLREDGVIFVSIDDNEVHNLRLLMNEIFGEENFVAQIPWRKRTAKSDVPFGVSQDYEWIICFAKTEGFIASIEYNGRKYYETPDFPNRPWRIHDMTTQRSANERPNCFFTIINPKTKEEYPANPNRVWANNEETFKEYYSANRIVFPGDYDFLNISKPVLRYWKEDDEKKAGENFGKVAVSTKLPDDIGMSQDGTKEMTSLFDTKVFSYPKPVALLKYLVGIVSNTNDIILDFFSGSCTTAHAIMQLNKEDGGHRKYICVQLPELCDETSEAYKAGYNTIAEIGKERIRRASAKIRIEIEVEQAKQKEQLQFEEQPIEIPDLGFKVFKLSESNFKQWREIKGSNKEEWKQQMLDFLNPVAKNATTDNMVYELLLKSGKSLNSTIEHHSGFYAINSKELILMLESATQETVDAIRAEHPQKVIALDNLFEGNDQLKTNTALQMRDAGVEFRTI